MGLALKKMCITSRTAGMSHLQGAHRCVTLHANEQAQAAAGGQGQARLRSTQRQNCPGDVRLVSAASVSMSNAQDHSAIPGTTCVKAANLTSATNAPSMKTSTNVHGRTCASKRNT